MYHPSTVAVLRTNAVNLWTSKICYVMFFFFFFIRFTFLI